MAVVHEPAAGLWAIGPDTLGDRALTTATAPDLELPRPRRQPVPARRATRPEGRDRLLGAGRAAPSTCQVGRPCAPSCTPRLEVVTVCLDDADAARPHIEAAAPDHPSLVDPGHRMDAPLRRRQRAERRLGGRGGHRRPAARARLARLPRNPPRGVRRPAGHGEDEGDPGGRPARPAELRAGPRRVRRRTARLGGARRGQPVRPPGRRGRRPLPPGAAGGLAGRRALRARPALWQAGRRDLSPSRTSTPATGCSRTTGPTAGRPGRWWPRSGTAVRWAGSHRGRWPGRSRTGRSRATSPPTWPSSARASTTRAPCDPRPQTRAMTSVLVSGASIAGPTTAAWLSRAGNRRDRRRACPRPPRRGPEHRRPGRRPRGAAPDGLEEAALAHGTASRAPSSSARVVASSPASPPAPTTPAGPTAELEILRGRLGQLLFEHTRDDVAYRFGDQITALAQDPTASTSPSCRGSRSATTSSSSPTASTPAPASWSCRTPAPLPRHGHRLPDHPAHRRRHRWWRWYVAGRGRGVNLRPDDTGTTRAALNVMTDVRGIDALDRAAQVSLLRRAFAAPAGRPTASSPHSTTPPSTSRTWPRSTSTGGRSAGSCSPATPPGAPPRSAASGRRWRCRAPTRWPPAWPRTTTTAPPSPTTTPNAAVRGQGAVAAPGHPRPGQPRSELGVGCSARAHVGREPAGEEARHRTGPLRTPRRTSTSCPRRDRLGRAQPSTGSAKQPTRVSERHVSLEAVHS